MNQSTTNTILRCATAVALSLTFATGAAAGAMSKAERKSAMDSIGSDYKAAISACASLTGNARDICKAEAKGKENVAKAEIEARDEPSEKHTYAVSIAKAKAEYAVAKEKCDDKSAADKTACQKEAKSAEARAMDEAKAHMKSADAGKNAKVAAAAPASKREAPGEYVDDSAITAKIKAAIFEESTLKSAEINVETYKGTVQLTGFVRSRTDINKAVEVARKVKGVTSVKNDMIVKGQQ